MGSKSEKVRPLQILIVGGDVSVRTGLKRVVSETGVAADCGFASSLEIAAKRLVQTHADLILVHLSEETEGLVGIMGQLMDASRSCSVICLGQSDPGLDKHFDHRYQFIQLDREIDLKSDTNKISARMSKILDRLGPRTLKQEEPSRKPAELVHQDSKTPKRENLSGLMPKAIVIASSTGGPQALTSVAEMLRPPLRVPVFIAQHMPPDFTHSLAIRLGKVSGIECVEAKHDEIVQAKVYIAPGDYHMRLKRRGQDLVIALDQGPKVNSVRPAADLLFESASKIYGDKCMGFILTGMGRDGVDGAAHLRARGAKVMIQDEATSVVWGMPGSAFEEDQYDCIGPLDECGDLLNQVACGTLISAIARGS